MAWVKVSDNGDAIPDEDRDRIFESYESAHKPGGQPGPVGLGLFRFQATCQPVGWRSVVRVPKRRVDLHIHAANGSRLQLSF